MKGRAEMGREEMMEEKNDECNEDSKRDSFHQ